jgi:2-haloacid dehalogenase
VTAARPVDAVFFDLFGTLLSLGPLDAACDRLAPGRGGEIAARWRTRQLEASWLRTAMERWVDFDTVTLDALRATLDELGITTEGDLATVADAFAELPLVEGAAAAVSTLKEAGLTTGILTNASKRTLERVAARLDLRLDHWLSVEPSRRYKPHPRVYQLAVDATAIPAERIGFVTANGWDAAGAGTFGLRVVWLRPNQSAALPAVGAPEPIAATWPDIRSIFTGSRTWQESSHA